MKLAKRDRNGSEAAASQRMARHVATIKSKEEAREGSPLELREHDLWTPCLGIGLQNCESICANCFKQLRVLKKLKRPTNISRPFERETLDNITYF
jgi:hypothetical protein